MPRFPEEAQAMRGWWSAALAFSVTALVWIVVSKAISAFLVLFGGILLAEGVRPYIEVVARRMPRGAAVGVVFGGLFVFTFAIVAILVQPLGVQIERFATGLPSYVESLQKDLVTFQARFSRDPNYQNIVSSVGNLSGPIVTDLAGRLLGAPLYIVTLLTDFTLALLYAVAWVLVSDDLLAFVLSLFAGEFRTEVRNTFHDIAQKLGAYLQAVVLNGTIVGIATGIGLFASGVPYALLLGFISGVLQAIPTLGPIVSGGIVILVVFATSGTFKAAIVAGIIAVVQVVDGNILSPIIFNRRVDLSFFVIVFATVLGATLLGIGGAFLAVPGAAALQVIVTRLVAPAIRRATGASAAI